MGLAKNLVLFVVVLLVAAVLVLGYMGFVPGLSDIMGVNRPRDLGVKYTSADLQSINQKAGVTYTDLPKDAAPQQSEAVTGSKQVQLTVTSSELTALVNSHGDDWKYYPIDDAQVKIENDGSIKMTGVLRTDRLPGYIQAAGATGADVEKYTSYLGSLPSNPPFYADWNMQVVNGKVSGDVRSLKIGNLDVPADQIAGNKQLLFSAIEGRLEQLHMSATSVKVVNGQLVYSGTVPTSVALSPP